MTAEALQDHGAGPHERMVVEAGSEYVQRMPERAIFVLPQVRKTMDNEGLDDLRAAIIKTDDDGNLVGLDLQNPPIVADLDPEEAERYLHEANQFWGEDFSLDGIDAHPETGRYTFLIAGHRRLRVLREAAETYNRDITLPVSVRRNISFEEALIIQLKENVYKAPEPTDIAEAIRRAYDYRKASNPGYTQAECAKELGFTPSRVSRALAYSELPDEIKGWVKNKDMSFNLAVILGHIQKEYALRYEQMHREGMLSSDDHFDDADHYAAYEIQTFGYRVRAILQRNRRSGGQALDRASGQLKTLRMQRQYAQAPLDFLVEVESAHHRRQTAVLDLANFALRGFAAAAAADVDVIDQALRANPGAAQAFEAALRRHNERLGTIAGVMF
jgi:hypothetical protein